MKLGTHNWNSSQRFPRVREAAIRTVGGAAAAVGGLYGFTRSAVESSPGIYSKQVRTGSDWGRMVARPIGLGAAGLVGGLRAVVSTLTTPLGVGLDTSVDFAAGYLSGTGDAANDALDKGVQIGTEIGAKIGKVAFGAVGGALGAAIDFVEETLSPLPSPSSVENRGKQTGERVGELLGGGLGGTVGSVMGLYSSVIPGVQEGATKSKPAIKRGGNALRNLPQQNQQTLQEVVKTGGRVGEMAGSLGGGSLGTIAATASTVTVGLKEAKLQAVETYQSVVEYLREPS